MTDIPNPDTLLRPDQPVDLSNCEREPIHIPSRIQPHGILLTLHEPEFTITQISSNTEAILSHGASDLLGKPLSALVQPADLEALEAACQHHALDNNPEYLLTMQLGANHTLFDAIVHRSQGVLVLELEPRLHPNLLPDTYGLVRQAIPQIQGAGTLVEMFNAVAQHVRRINGFDRVMVYQFDAEGHGSVVAESKQDDLEPFLGLHYPASDIPPQARRLYTLNLLRLIADVGYTPADVLPAVNPQTNHLLDMSYCVLRSVSPIHVQYLQNMGAGASMSISILKDGELWGLIACHHNTPRFVNYDIRTACEFLGQVVSLQLSTKQDAADIAYQMRLKDVQAELIANMAAEPQYAHALISDTPNLLNFIQAGGAAVCGQGECLCIGQTPEPAFLTQLISWLAEQGTPELFATEQLPHLFPPAEAVKEIASGLLAVVISPQQHLLWFRPEVIQTVNWAGNPNKPVEIAADGSQRLSPRGSFALWQQTVQGKSLPWKAVEKHAALELQRAIIGIILHKAEQLEALNAQLQRSNAELDAFTYIASHDLREPLRGIRNYVQFLREDHGEALNAEGMEQLAILLRLTQRMETLIDSLLRYSRVGQQELILQETDLNQIVSEIVEGMHPQLQAIGVEIRIPRPLPVVLCDAVQIGEIYGNLLSNAVKYNDKPDPWIEIGYVEGEEARKLLNPQSMTHAEVSILRGVPQVFYVRDNGIGIRDKHLDTVFRIFKRLHAREEYGGGTGAGLTIARKMAERHGGKLWVSSVYGEGTTFYFTLQKADIHEH